MPTVGITILRCSAVAVKQAVRCYREKPRPSRVMETGVRAIDTFNPLAEGGTGFIPGPFGAGKTVLQHAISKQPMPT